MDKLKKDIAYKIHDLEVMLKEFPPKDVFQDPERDSILNLKCVLENAIKCIDFFNSVHNTKGGTPQKR